MKFSEEASERLGDRQIVYRKKVSPVRLQELMGGVDVNLAPLRINRFTNCKSELKFFEAGAVETTTIASPSYAFKEAISDNENGVLAKKDEWFRKIKYLYENPKENLKLAKAAKKTAMKEYYGRKMKEKIEQAFERLT